MNALADWVEGARVVFCVGAGGVGKTTLSASLALEAALRGRQVVVLTIDPARRLANALGLNQLGGVPSAIDLTALAAVASKPGGALHGLMLDQRASWDRLIERHAPNDTVRQRILANPFYQHLASTFAGSYEYAAIDVVLALVDARRYDLIVVDTPPARHALDFFQAPDRVLAFLDHRVVRWLLLPYQGALWGTARALGRVARGLLGRLEQAAGLTTLLQMSDLFADMTTMAEALQARAAAIKTLVRADTTARILVATAEERSLAQAAQFVDEMHRLDLPPTAVVFNRMHAAPEAALLSLGAQANPSAGLNALQALLEAAGLRPDLHQWVVNNALAHARGAENERRRVAAFLGRYAPVLPVFRMHRLEQDMHDLQALWTLSQATVDQALVCQR